MCRGRVGGFVFVLRVVAGACVGRWGACERVPGGKNITVIPDIISRQRNGNIRNLRRKAVMGFPSEFRPAVAGDSGYFPSRLSPRRMSGMTMVLLPFVLMAVAGACVGRRRACERIPPRHRSNLQRKTRMPPQERRHEDETNPSSPAPPQGGVPSTPVAARRRMTTPERVKESPKTKTPRAVNLWRHACLTTAVVKPLPLQTPSEQTATTPKPPPRAAAKTQPPRAAGPPAACVPGRRPTHAPATAVKINATAPPRRHSGIFRRGASGDGKYPESPAPAGRNSMGKQIPPEILSHALLWSPRATDSTPPICRGGDSFAVGLGAVAGADA